MGARYRKSINLGGGFRINISKSGVGYSWGIPGYRITKTAKGKTRKTYSIPGTGFSYVDEGQTHEQNTATPKTSSEQNKDVTIIENANISNFQGDEYADFFRKIEKAKTLNSTGLYLTLIGAILLVVSFVLLSNFNMILAIFSAIFGVMTIIGIVLMIAAHTAGVVHMEYDFDEVGKAEYENRFSTWKILQNNTRVWQILSSMQNTNLKANAGASSSVLRSPVFFSGSLPYFLRANVPVIYIKLQKEQLVVLPDKLLIFNGDKIGAVNYSDLKFDVSYTRFVEEQAVPSDTEILDHTWKYVNKNGSPDKRYSDNRQLPVCRYGELHITSSSGVNTMLMVSNPDTISKFVDEN